MTTTRSTTTARGPTLFGLGLALNGLAAFAFLSMAGRALGPSAFAPLSIMWSTMYLVGVGLFLPFEQEITRAVAANDERGESARGAISRAGEIQVALLLLVAIPTVLARGAIADELFHGNSSYVWMLLLGVAGIASGHFIKGVMAGRRRYGLYGTWYFVDSITRIVPTALFAVAGLSIGLPYALVAAGSALVATISVAWKAADLGPRGHPPTWPSLLSSLGFLLCTSLTGAVMMNVGTIAVGLLAAEQEKDRAGVFLSGLVIARVPLFLFQAVQALVLPQLSEHVAADRRIEFHRDVRRLLRLLMLFLIAGTLGAAVAGTFVLTTLFGSDFAQLSRVDFALLALSSLLLLVGLSVNQAQIALNQQRLTAIPWLAGVATFTASVALFDGELYTRVGTALAIGSVVVAAVAYALLNFAMSAWNATGTPSDRSARANENRAREGR